MSLVLVTGATGFTGKQTVLALLARGYEVRGTMRSLSRAEEIHRVLEPHAPDVRRRVHFVETSLESDAGWDAALDGCDAVLHVASPMPFKMPDDPNELIVPAREGVLRILAIAARQGIRRVVMCSSTSAICDGHPPGRRGPYTEEDWTNLDNPAVPPYPRSKTIAERAAWDFVRTRAPQVEFATVQPGLILGPLLDADYGVSPDFVRQILSGQMKGFPRLCYNPVDVRDVAGMMIDCMEKPQAVGQRFLCAATQMWLAEFGACLRRNFPSHADRISTVEVPDEVLIAQVGTNPQAAALVPRLGQEIAYDTGKAQRLLGFRFRTSEEAVVETARSLIALGLA
ncbi:MAG: SDR family oxidoreductase [Gammaproteobacteria bacterium]